jgi:hypothetical protein
MMNLTELCELNTIVAAVNSQQDLEANTLLMKKFHYAQYYKDEETDAEFVSLYNGDEHTKLFIFKGTDSLKDWETNLDFKPVAVIPGHPDFKIHRGFYEQFLGLATFIRKEMTKFEYKCPRVSRYPQFILSGHSLGGTLAIITALHMYSIRPSLVRRVVTFGSPRVLCKDLTEWYNDHLSSRTIRVVNFFDTIPKLPPPGPILEYCHVNSTLFLFKYGYLVPERDDEPTSIGYYYRKCSGFVKGLLMRSYPHNLSHYLNMVQSFAFLKQYRI